MSTRSSCNPSLVAVGAWTDVILKLDFETISHRILLLIAFSFVLWSWGTRKTSNVMRNAQNKSEIKSIRDFGSECFDWMICEQFHRVLSTRTNEKPSEMNVFELNGSENHCIQHTESFRQTITVPRRKWVGNHSWLLKKDDQIDTASFRSGRHPEDTVRVLWNTALLWAKNVLRIDCQSNLDSETSSQTWTVVLLQKVGTRFCTPVGIRPTCPTFFVDRSLWYQHRLVWCQN